MIDKTTKLTINLVGHKTITLQELSELFEEQFEEIGEYELSDIDKRMIKAPLELLLQNIIGEVLAK